MTSTEIRQGFLDFFRGKGHEIVRSAPVFPQDDPTLLFTNAGMNQFKDVFLNQGTRPYSRAVDTQKCIRVSGKHNDLEEVGQDTYHHTFFEMLGNWSFGDYYKREAIQWAWELLTDVWGLPKDRLWATVHHTDDEALELWKEITDVDPDKVLKFGDKDNFWEMGEVGPCGPCSEIHIDLTADGCSPDLVNAGVPEVMELWNLVFIQYDRKADSSLEELPAKHVDTGMGMERITAVLQGKNSNYDTDLFRTLLDAVEEISGKTYEGEHQVAMRVIVDHIRTLSFAIADGALPSNEGRGYVLRRLLRRAARFGRTLGLEEPFIHQLVPTLVAKMGDYFTELVERQSHVETVIRSEEESFGRTLSRGLDLFEDVAARLKDEKAETFPGEDAFKLYDTYGFPIDLTELMARENGLGVDEARFEELMEEQRERARNAGKSRLSEGEAEDWQIIRDGEHSVFTGYESPREICRICQVRRQGESFHVVLSRTPFYGESGGQVGDQGVLRAGDFETKVVDTVREGDAVIHIVESLPEDLSVEIEAVVDEQRRLSIMRNHTSTHLLHAALHQTLGDHARQSGSMVAPDRLRFDFTHFEAIKPEEMEAIEEIVNRRIRENALVEIEEATFDEARAKGAMALFGEKYGDTVRMVSLGDYSRELCGGTHLKSTGQAGYFRVISEGSVAAGIRRIEAVSGDSGAEAVQSEHRLIRELRQLFPALKAEELVDQVKVLLDEKKALERELKKLKAQDAASGLQSVVDAATDVDGLKVVSAKVEVESPKDLKGMGDELRKLLGSGVGVLGAAIGPKVSMIAVVTDDLVKGNQAHAGKLVGAVAKLVGGGGGGQPHMAQAGGKDPAKLDEALAAVPDIVKEMGAG